MNSRSKSTFLLLCAVVLLLPRIAAAGAGDTAVADFNADGRPDVAVTRHATAADGANYRIDVRFSDGHHQSVTFVSAHHAVMVRALDIDNDDDIDLVVTPLLGHEVVSVWLNDGAGHFQRGEPSTLPSDWAVVSSTGLKNGIAPFALVTPAPRRDAAVLQSQPRPPTDPDATGALASAQARLPRSLFASPHPARAPPAHV